MAEDSDTELDAACRTAPHHRRPRNVVIAWNQVVIAAVRTESGHVGPLWTSRNMAIIHVSMFDAVNAISRRYEPYLVDEHAPRWASQEAAALAAGYEAAVSLYPAAEAPLRAAFESLLAEVAGGRAKRAGVSLGIDVARQIVASRMDDGAEYTQPFVPGDDPGEWRPTFPDFSPASWPSWGEVEPFAVTARALARFRPPVPPALTSGEYTAAFEEVKLLGGIDSDVRTGEQTRIARFWSYDTAATGSPVAHYNKIVADILRKRHPTVLQSARLFALLNLALADSSIATWGWKYEYDHWRPVTAIRQAADDDNPDTAADPEWLPLGFPAGGLENRTPAFPAYPAGHSVLGAAAFEMTALLLGTDHVRFVARSDEVRGTRRFERLSDAAEENGRSRIYMGVHWEYDHVEGVRAGRKIALYVFRHVLRPRSPELCATIVCPARWERAP